jgi:hypothetical protein
MSETRNLNPSTLFWQRLVSRTVLGLFFLLLMWIVVSVTVGVFGW